jgi:hypothetical protein
VLCHVPRLPLGTTEYAGEQVRRVAEELSPSRPSLVVVECSARDAYIDGLSRADDWFSEGPGPSAVLLWAIGVDHLGRFVVRSATVENSRAELRVPRSLLQALSPEYVVRPGDLR